MNGEEPPGRKDGIKRDVSDGRTIRTDTDTKKRLQVNLTRSLRRTAAAYSPTWWGSTIGDGGLNFSVRNGKRWFPAAIATAICYLRETTRLTMVEIYSFFNFLAYLSLRKDFGLLVQVD